MLCLHDFGMVGYLTHAERQELLSCLASFVNKDIESFTRHFFHLALIDSQSDLAGYRKDLVGLLNEFFYSPDKQSIAWVFFRAMNKGVLRGVHFPADLALFGKAIVTTEAMGLKLYPEFDFNEVMKPFVRKALKSYLSPANAAKAIESNIFDYLEFLKDLPEHIQRVIQRLEKNEISMKLDTTDFMSIMGEFNRQNSVRILGVMLVAVFLATISFLYLEGKKELLGFPISTLSLILFLALLLWFLIRVRRGPG